MINYFLYILFSLFGLLLIYKNKNKIGKVLLGIELDQAIEILEAVSELASGGEDGILDPTDAMDFIENLKRILAKDNEGKI